MKGAIQIVRVAGIPVRMHWSFGILILWVVYTAISYDLGIQGTLVSVAVVMTIFLCVVLHEYGHALMARRFGVATRDIILSPIGGVARLDSIPENPREEILIAVAGPAVNLVIAAILLGIAILFTPYWVDLGSRQFWGLDYAQPILIIIAKINLILLVFNLVPAFPMDGGRVLRALLSIPLGRVKATTYAGLLGQLIGIFLFGAGVIEIVFGKAVYIGGLKVSDFILAIIGVFIYFAARREIQAVRAKHVFESTTIGQITNQGTRLLPANLLMDNFDEDIDADSGILLESEGKVIGILFKELVDQAKSDNRYGARLGDYTSDFYEDMDARLRVSTAIDVFNKKGYRICPVYTEGVLTGVLHRSALLDFISGNVKSGKNILNF